MEVEKRQFRKRYVQIKYFEASWPEAHVAHRIQPLHGSLRAHTKKGTALMMRTSSRSMMTSSRGLTVRIHVAESNGHDSGVSLAQRRQQTALNSLHLVGSTAPLHGDNRICIWLEDVWSER